MKRNIKINLQQFAEDTTQINVEDTSIDNQGTQVKVKDPFVGLFNRDKKEPEVKVQNEPEVTEPVLETKEPEEFIPINHLGKEVKIPIAERDTYLQKGCDYDYVKKEGKKAKAIIERIAKIEGFSRTDDFISNLDKFEQQRQEEQRIKDEQTKARLVEEIEEADGDTKKIDEIIKNHPIVRHTQEERRRLEDERRRLEYSDKIKELKDKQFFAELEPQLNELLEKNPTIEPKLAFSVLVGEYVLSDDYKEKMEKEREEAAKEMETTKTTTEKKVLADIHDKERRSTPTGGNSTDGSNLIQQTEFGKQLSSIFRLPKDAAQRAAQRVYENTKRR